MQLLLDTLSISSVEWSVFLLLDKYKVHESLILLMYSSFLSNNNNVSLLHLYHTIRIIRKTPFSVGMGEVHLLSCSTTPNDNEIEIKY